MHIQADLTKTPVKIIVSANYGQDDVVDFSATMARLRKIQVRVATETGCVGMKLKSYTTAVKMHPPKTEFVGNGMMIAQCLEFTPTDFVAFSEFAARQGWTPKQQFYPRIPQFGMSARSRITCRFYRSFHGCSDCPKLDAGPSNATKQHLAIWP